MLQRQWHTAFFNFHSQLTSCVSQQSLMFTASVSMQLKAVHTTQTTNKQMQKLSCEGDWMYPFFSPGFVIDLLVVSQEKSERQIREICFTGMFSAAFSGRALSYSTTNCTFLMPSPSLPTWPEFAPSK